MSIVGKNQGEIGSKINAFRAQILTIVTIQTSI